jgi:hypothetical protein
MSEFILKLWSTLLIHQNLLNASAVFSYETMSSVYFEICSLYSNLFYNPQDQLVQNNSKEMKTLLDMVDNFSLISHTMNQTSTTSNTTAVIEESSCSIIIRLKFVIFLMEDRAFFEICNKNMSNFQCKLVNFLIYVYLNSNSSAGSNNVPVFSLKNSNENNSSIFDKELNRLVELFVSNLSIFKELNMTFNSNLEQIVIGFIEKYSKLLKNTQVKKCIFLII